MQIVMVGSGYVGLVTGVCLAHIGHHVTCVDVDRRKLALLQEGVSPIFEPGLEKLIKENVAHDRLGFTEDLPKTLHKADILFITIGTPSLEDGSADLSNIFKLAKEIGQHIERDLFVVMKSTVPVGTCDQVEAMINKEILNRGKECRVTLASNPEFLKEGTAISDFMKPDRIVVGLEQDQGRDFFVKLYSTFTRIDPAKLLFVQRRTSEFIKYAANSMLATRISFINELSQLCEKLHVDIDQVRLGIGMDPRIGKEFIYAGPGYGGSCFPKDVSALIDSAQKNGCSLSILEAVRNANDRQINFVTAKVVNHFSNLEGKKIGVWGLGFKPNTDDVRDAPSLSFVRMMLQKGAHVHAHDPEAIENFAAEFGPHPHLFYYDDAYDALVEADALVLLTEWNEYRWPNWPKVKNAMRGCAIFDFRNQYEASELIQNGFYYECVGRLDSKQELRSSDNRTSSIKNNYLENVS